MAKDTSVRVALTQSLVNTLTFEEPVIGFDKGKFIVDKKGPGKRRDWVVRDASTPGFSVRVYPAKAVYQVGRKMGMRVGQLPARRSATIRRIIGDTRTMKLEEARRTAQAWLGQMAQGVDPHQKLRESAQAAAERESRDKLTFGKFYEKYAKSGGVKQTSLDDRAKVIGWMEQSPLWAHPIHQLDSEVVRESLQPLFKAALGRGKSPGWGPQSNGLATAWKIYRHTAAAYSAFVGEQGIEFSRNTSPFATVKKSQNWPAVKARSGHLDTTDDSHVLWLKALVDARDHEDPAKQVFADFLLLSLIWGGRRREIQLLQWDALDIEEKQTGQFIGENTKSGLDHFFPLTPWALEILLQRRERNSLWGRDGDWVFPSDHHGKPIYDYRGLLEHLKEQSGVWLTAHDMRRTVATDALELTGSEMFVSMALGHSKADTDVTMRYVKRRVGLLRPIFEQRERALMALVGLQSDAPASSPIDALIEFLRDGKEDPTERASLERKAEGMLIAFKG